MFFRKKAILLVHGFVGGTYDFGNFHNELQVYRNFDVFTFTLHAHEKPVVKNVEYIDWIKSAERQMEFLINHNYKEIYVIGHSMGGVIASYLASAYPQVKKLVLAAPAFRYFYFLDGKINLKNINETIKNIPEIFANQGAESVIERIRKTPITTLIEFTKLVNAYQDSIKHITCPTLTIHGLSDNVVPSEATDYVHKNLLSQTNILVNIKNVNHNCFCGTNNEIVKDTIVNFLRKKPTKKKVTRNI